MNSYRYCSIYHAVAILNDLNVLQWFQWMFVFDVEKRENSCSRGFSLQFSQTRSLAVDIDTLVIQHVPFFPFSISFHLVSLCPDFPISFKWFPSLSSLVRCVSHFAVPVGHRVPREGHEKMWRGTSVSVFVGISASAGLSWHVDFTLLRFQLTPFPCCELWVRRLKLCDHRQPCPAFLMNLFRQQKRNQNLDMSKPSWNLAQTDANRFSCTWLMKDSHQSPQLGHCLWLFFLKARFWQLAAACYSMLGNGLLPWCSTCSTRSQVWTWFFSYALVSTARSPWSHRVH